MCWFTSFTHRVFIKHLCQALISHSDERKQSANKHTCCGGMNTPFSVCYNRRKEHFLITDLLKSKTYYHPREGWVLSSGCSVPGYRARSVSLGQHMHWGIARQWPEEAPCFINTRLWYGFGASAATLICIALWGDRNGLDRSLVPGCTHQRHPYWAHPGSLLPLWRADCCKLIAVACVLHPNNWSKHI